jgi:hypothetical protein
MTMLRGEKKNFEDSEMRIPEAMYTVSNVPMTARTGIQNRCCNFDKTKQTKPEETQDTYLVSSLDHSLLALHLDVLLLLGVSQGEWHTEQESTGADNPEGLSTE